MAPRLTEPHPRIESTRGCVAIERGPLVYCLEQADSASASVLDVCLDPAAPLGQTWRADLLGGVVTVQASGEAVEVTSWGPSTFRPLRPGGVDARHRVELTAILYFAWANRRPGPMRVWIPLAPPAPA